MCHHVYQLHFQPLEQDIRTYPITNDDNQKQYSKVYQ